MIPGLLQSCSTSQLPNPALPPGQPGQSEIQVEGLALADDIMAGWRGGGGADQSAPDVNKITICSYKINICSLSLVVSDVHMGEIIGLSPAGMQFWMLNLCIFLLLCVGMKQ